MAEQKLVIAIDGLPGSGKGTLARELGARFDCAVLDTGAIYRLVGKTAREAGLDLSNDATVGAHARTLVQTLKWDDLNGPALRSQENADAASKVSALPAVRAALLDIQRRFAANPPEMVNGKPCRGAILDGQDIGTVVCPDASVKFFLTASLEVRAQRRVEFLTRRGFQTTYEEALAALRDRDARDLSRAAAPIKPAADAHLIDTTEITIEEVLKRAEGMAQAHVLSE